METWVLECIVPTYRPREPRPEARLLQISQYSFGCKGKIQLIPANPQKELYWLITWKL